MNNALGLNRNALWGGCSEVAGDITLIEATGRRSFKGDGNVSRRTFLKLSAAVSSLLYFSPVLALQRLNCCQNGASGQFWLNGVCLWEIDATWLAGSPKVLLKRNGTAVLASLSNARYPGTNISADFEATIRESSAGLLIDIKHSLGTEIHTTPFADWVEGKSRAFFVDAGRDLSLPLQGAPCVAISTGTSFSIGQALDIVWTTGQNLRVSGKRFRGYANRVSILKLDRQETSVLNSPESWKRSTIEIEPAESQLVLEDITNPIAGTRVTGGALNRIVVDAAESESGSVGGVSVAYLDDNFQIERIDAARQIDFSVSGADPRFVSFVDENGSSTEFHVALPGEARFVQNDVVLLAGPTDAADPLEVTHYGEKTSIESSYCFDRIFFPSHREQTMVLRFDKEHPVPGGDDINLFKDLPATIDLTYAELEISRPADAMSLRFRFDNFLLKRNLFGRYSLHEKETEPGKGRMRVVMPPQILARQAFLDPSEWKAANANLGPKPPQVSGAWVGKQAQLAFPNDPNAQRVLAQKVHDDHKQSDVPPNPEFPGSFPIRTWIAEESWIVYRLADAKQRRALAEEAVRLEVLFDSNIWEIVVAADAASDETARDKLVAAQPDTTDLNRTTGDTRYTSIEYPCALYVSPDQTAYVTPLPLRIDENARQRDLFALRISAKDADANGFGLRAIGARYFDSDGGFNPAKLPLHYSASNGVGFRRSLDDRDRAELVNLTSVWKQRALKGTTFVRDLKKDETPSTDEYKGIYVPQPIVAKDFTLTSFGGNLDATLVVDPPALRQFALSVEKYDHKSSDGLIEKEIVIYEGYILPLCQRASVIKVTHAEEYETATGVATLEFQRFYLGIIDPVRDRDGDLAPYSGRTWPFSRTTVTNKGMIRIEAPGTNHNDLSLTVNGVASYQGQSAFYVRAVGGNPLYLDFLVDDDPGRKGQATVLFIDNTIAHDANYLAEVQGIFNSSTMDKWGLTGTAANALYYMLLNGTTVTFAPPSKPGDTSYQTFELYAKLNLVQNLVNTALLEGRRRSPLFPEMAHAEIAIPAMAQFAGQGATDHIDVEWADIFRQVGFTTQAQGSGKGNPAEIFLHLLQPPIQSFNGKGDRAGGVATPNHPVPWLSRPIGLLASDGGTGGNGGAPLAAVRANRAMTRAKANTSSQGFSVRAEDFFSADAKLLGVVPLSMLFDALGLGDIPKFIESAKQQLNSAESEVLGKASAYVGTALGTIPNIQTEIASLPKCELALRLTQSVSDIQGDLLKLQSTLKGNPSPGDIIQALDGVASGLQSIQSDVNAAQQNPSMLVPMALLDLIAEWERVVQGLQTALQGFQAALTTQAKNLGDAIKQAFADEVNGLRSVIGETFSRRLMQLANALVDQALVAASQTLKLDDMLDRANTLFNAYVSLYSEALGALAEINRNTDAIKQILDAAGNLSRAMTFVGTGSVAFNGQQLSLGAFASDLDGQLRNLKAGANPGNDNPYLRDFYQGIDPAILALGTSTVAFVPAGGTVQLNIHTADCLQNLRRALNDISTAWKALSSSDQIKISSVVTRIGDIDGFAGSLAAGVWSDASSALAISIAALQQALTAAVGAAQLPQFLNQLSVDSADIANNSLPGLARLSAFADLCNSIAVADSFVHQTGAVKSAIAAAVSALEQTAGAPAQRAACFTSSVVELICPWSAASPPPAPDWLVVLRNYAFLLTPDVVKQVEQAVKDLFDLDRNYLHPICANPTAEAILRLPAQIQQVSSDWKSLVQAVNRLTLPPIALPSLNQIAKYIAGMLADFIPATIDITYNYNTGITRDFEIFKAGLTDGDTCQLALNSHISFNAISGATDARFAGTVTKFRINLFDLLVLPVKSISFEARTGMAPRLSPPDLGEIQFGGCMNFVEALKSFFGKQGGPYVIPGLTGIRAGYLQQFADITDGYIVFANFSLDASIDIPFDMRAATVNFSVASRESPCLIAVIPYGGTFYFTIAVAGDRLVSVDAGISYGLAGEFSLGGGMVKGVGLVQVGLGYHQSGGSMTLEGYFFAGGSATVLGFISISASLRLSLIDQDGSVTGSAQFQASIGCGLFKVTYSYTVSYQVAGGGGGDEPAAEVKALAQTSSNDDGIIPVQLFYDEDRWRQFRRSWIRETVNG
jgi:hypothetical protein